jgi:hypothetical protein
MASTKLLGLVLFGVVILSGQDKIPPPRTPQTAFVTNTFSGVVKPELCTRLTHGLERCGAQATWNP